MHRHRATTVRAQVTVALVPVTAVGMVMAVRVIDHHRPAQDPAAVALAPAGTAIMVALEAVVLRLAGRQVTSDRTATLVAAVMADRAVVTADPTLGQTETALSRAPFFIRVDVSPVAARQPGGYGNAAKGQ